VTTPTTPAVCNPVQVITASADETRAFAAELQRFVENSHPGLLQTLREKKNIDAEVEKDLHQCLKDFTQTWEERGQPVAA